MTMEAGRELDKLIAEKVMGCYNLTHYSTDIKAAWEVVEKLPWFVLRRLGNGRWQCEGRWCGDILPHVTGSCGCVVTEADTAPLAIYLAALEVTKGDFVAIEQDYWDDL